MRGAEEAPKRQAPVSRPLLLLHVQLPSLVLPHQTRHAGPEGVHCHPGLDSPRQLSAPNTIWRQPVPLGWACPALDTEGVSQASIVGGGGSVGWALCPPVWAQAGSWDSSSGSVYLSWLCCHLWWWRDCKLCWGWGHICTICQCSETVAEVFDNMTSALRPWLPHSCLIFVYSPYPLFS